MILGETFSETRFFTQEGNGRKPVSIQRVSSSPQDAGASRFRFDVNIESNEKCP